MGASCVERFVNGLVPIVRDGLLNRELTAGVSHISQPY